MTPDHRWRHSRPRERTARAKRRIYGEQPALTAYQQAMLDWENDGRSGNRPKPEDYETAQLDATRTP